MHSQKTYFLAALLAMNGSVTLAQTAPKAAAANSNKPAPAMANPTERYQQLIESARQDLQAGNFTQALGSAQQAARIDTGDYKAPYYIAYAQMSLGDYEGAAEAQQRSMGLAGDAARAIVAELGQTIKHRREVVNADAALAEGLFAKAARLYIAAWDAGVPQGEVALKAAQLSEQRLNDVGTAARLYRDLTTRMPGTAAADKAVSELQRLRPQLASQDRARLTAVLQQPAGQRRAQLEAAIAANPDARELQVLLANEAAKARDWALLERQLKRLSQRGWAEDALRMRHVDLSGWEGDLRLRQLLEDTWGPDQARQMLLARTLRDCPEAHCPELVGIPAGTVQMGSAADEPGRNVNEGPQHLVTVPGFAFGRTEVTVRQWRALMGSVPATTTACAGNADDCPVDQVTWSEAEAYVRKLSEVTGKRYRLPSEAEWEYAARAGTLTPYLTGTGITGRQANFNDSAAKPDGTTGVNLGKLAPVASYAANLFGLFDLSGNVWEWTADCWHASYDGAPIDGSAWTTGGNCDTRVARGGGWHNGLVGMRSAQRGETKAGAKLGLRVVRAPQL